MAIGQRPNVAGLLLCQLVIVEEKTKNVTLANSFQTLAVDSFPSRPVPFAVYTVLSDGLGEIDLNLVVSRCDTLDDIYIRSMKTNFTNPLRQLRLWWHTKSCSFPVPGFYQFGLQVNGEQITQCVLKVVQKETSNG